jgi:lysozyme
MRPIPKEAEAFIKKHERLVLRVYDDKHPKRILQPGDEVEGVLTAGWGHTGGLEIGQKVTRAQAQAWFDSDVPDKAIRPLYAKLGAELIDELTDGQYGALISFVFNLGTGDPRKREWTIWKRLRARQFDQVPVEMMKFVNWDGKKSQGLVKRRTAEVALWSSNEPGSEPSNPPSSVTRREATPPTPADPTPPQKSATLITSALGVTATVPVAAKQVTDAIEPYKDSSPLVGNMIAIVATIAALAAVIVLALTWINKRKARS